MLKYTIGIACITTAAFGIPQLQNLVSVRYDRETLPFFRRCQRIAVSYWYRLGLVPHMPLFEHAAGWYQCFICDGSGYKLVPDDNPCTRCYGERKETNIWGLEDNCPQCSRKQVPCAICDGWKVDWYEKV